MKINLFYTPFLWSVVIYFNLIIYEILDDYKLRESRRHRRFQHPIKVDICVYCYYTMSKLASSNGYKVNKKILEYQCGCKYSFQDYTKLEHVCFTHENELIAQCG